jgi:hypothetical protein
MTQEDHILDIAVAAGKAILQAVPYLLLLLYMSKSLHAWCEITIARASCSIMRIDLRTPGSYAKRQKVLAGF